MKLYSDEVGHEIIRRVRNPIVSCLARVEVPGAIWRKQRIGELSVAHTAALTAAFEHDYCGDPLRPPRFIVVDLPPSVLDDAARFVAVHGLRALDSIQLASALAARTADPGCTAFACFDEALRAAAAAQAFTLVPADA